EDFQLIVLTHAAKFVGCLYKLSELPLALRENSTDVLGELRMSFENRDKRCPIHYEYYCFFVGDDICRSLLASHERHFSEEIAVFKFCHRMEPTCFTDDFHSNSASLYEIHLSGS